ncbi:MAG: hypothetical protein CUN53_02520 [Phototrophicales bacterium]|nr:MAG: hypothetical protein CUN53_02520 [Phototrophicales bacterium]
MSRVVVILLIILGIASAALLWVSTSLFGIGADSQSIDAISTARSLIAGDGWLTYDERPYIDAPLYLLILTLSAPLNTDMLTFARIVNAACMAGIVLLGGLWLVDNLRSRLVRVVGVALTLASAPVFASAHFAQKHALFALLILGGLIALDSYTQRRRVRDLAIAAVIVSLSCLTDYAGLALALAGMVIILLDRGAAARKIALLIGFALIVLAPVGLWLVNDGVWTLFNFVTPIGDAVARTFDVIWSWIVPIALPIDALKAVIVVGAMALSIGALILVIMRHYRNGFPAMWYRVALMAVFLLGYVLLLIAGSGDTAAYAALYVPFILFGASIVDRSLTARQLIPLLIGAGMALLVGIASASRMISIFTDSRTDGAGGYTMTSWVKSPLMARLDSLPEGVIVSNAPDAVYLLAGRSALPVPDADAPLIIDPDGEPVYWIVFTDPDALYRAPTVDEMKARYGIEVVFEDLDGFVYRLTGIPEEGGSG